MTDIFFDLDRTLWDFEANSRETLEEIYGMYDLKEAGIPSGKRFTEVYEGINANMWEQYRNGVITKEFLRNRRFYNTIMAFHIDDHAVAESMAGHYIAMSPRKTKLIPGVRELLGKLETRYTLHIITNGFTEVQYFKLNNCGIRDFFGTVTTSEEAGAVKPDSRFFKYVIEKTGIRKEQALVVGDDIRVDIEGALNAGISAVWFNRNGRSRNDFKVRTITRLDHLLTVLSDC